MPSKDRAAWYRDLADQLWRLSLDQRRDIQFVARSRLASIAQDFEEVAVSVERKMAAD